MSTTDPFDPQAAEPAATGDAAAVGAESAEAREAQAQDAEARGAAADDAAVVELDRKPVIEEIEREVVLQRSVRHGRVIIGGAVVGVLLATLISLLTPMALDSEYTLGQIVGFMALIGGAIGLGVGAVVALLLGLVAKGQSGSGVAIQTDVR